MNLTNVEFNKILRGYSCVFVEYDQEYGTTALFAHINGTGEFNGPFGLVKVDLKTMKIIVESDKIESTEGMYIAISKRLAKAQSLIDAIVEREKLFGAQKFPNNVLVEFSRGPNFSSEKKFTLVKVDAYFTKSTIKEFCAHLQKISEVMDD